jgi:O-methyltransferase
MYIEQFRDTEITPTGSSLAGVQWDSIPDSAGEQGCAELYLDLLKKNLTRMIGGDTFRVIAPRTGSLKRAVYDPMAKTLARLGLSLVRLPNAAAAEGGPNMWTQGETMMGLPRLDNIHHCTLDVLRRNIPGDLIETGVWRGGGTILMRGVLKAYGDRSRTVWIADSFQGLPKPDGEAYAADAGNEFWREDRFAVSLEQVRNNFARYGLLDDRVRFLPGWFRDTLPRAPVERLSILRLDGDMYESTMDALRYLYPKLSPGGYVIVDDYGWVPNCQAAVDDYRTEHRIKDRMHVVEDHERSCVYWMKTN